MPERTNRVTIGMSTAARVTLGSTRYSGPKLPEVGKMRRLTLKTSMSMIPNQYGGVAWPINASPTPR